jgi:hypothetical protein
VLTPQYIAKHKEKEKRETLDTQEIPLDSGNNESRTRSVKMEAITASKYINTLYRSSAVLLHDLEHQEQRYSIEKFEK